MDLQNPTFARQLGLHFLFSLQQYGTVKCFLSGRLSFCDEYIFIVTLGFVKIFHRKKIHSNK